MSLSAGLYPLILLSLGVGVLEFLLPGDRNGKSTAAFRAVAGLCVLLAVLVPIGRGLSLLRDMASGGADSLRERLEQSGILPPDGETVGADDFAGQLAAVGEAEAERWVYAALRDTFGIPACDAAVQAHVTVTPDGSAQLAEVRISLSGSSALRNPHDIEKWFSDALGCPVTLSVA